MYARRIERFEEVGVLRIDEEGECMREELKDNDE